ILEHDRKLSSAMSQRTKGMLRMVSQTWLTIVLHSALLIASSAGILWWQGQQKLDNYTTIREQNSTCLLKTSPSPRDIGEHLVCRLLH
ncbi:hypothetical protein ACVGW1_18170, partial [Enterobacter intestinihominis]